MAVTEPDAEPHRRMSQIIVPADAPGVDDRAGPGDGPPRPRLDDALRGDLRRTCACRRRTSLGERGAGFLIAQKRLGPGRIHHVMRWLGQMQRAFELMCSRALEREAFGGPLAEKQTVQNWIADSAAEIQACRLLTLDAAHKIDEGTDARVEISLLKFYAADVLSRRDRPRRAGARRARPHRPLAARAHVPASRAARTSTTARTRCTAWSSAAGS